VVNQRKRREEMRINNNIKTRERRESHKGNNAKKK
jgi:hypothetical protein